MKNNNYPALLNKRARILASLNRSDLVMLGSMYLICSILNVSSLVIIVLSVVTLSITKFISGRLPRGFVQLHNIERSLTWDQKIGEVYEN